MDDTAEWLAEAERLGHYPAPPRRAVPNSAVREVAWDAEDTEGAGDYPAAEVPPRRPSYFREVESEGPDVPELLDPFEIWPALTDVSRFPDLPPDPRPRRDTRPDNRQVDRIMKRSHDGLGLVFRRMEPTWHGPIPNVGQSTATYRTHRYVRCPVRVDVVPVIHDRMRRGAQSARWAAGISYVQIDSDPRGMRWTVVKYREGDSPEDLASTSGATFSTTYRAGRGSDDGGGAEAHRARSMHQLVRTRPTTAPPRLPP
jgi:hypothetical protein